MRRLVVKVDAKELIETILESRMAQATDRTAEENHQCEHIQGLGLMWCQVAGLAVFIVSRGRSLVGRRSDQVGIEVHGRLRSRATVN